MKTFYQLAAILSLYLAFWGESYPVNLAGAICFCIACGVIGTVLATNDIEMGYYDDEE